MCTLRPDLQIQAATKGCHRPKPQQRCGRSVWRKTRGGMKEEKACALRSATVRAEGSLKQSLVMSSLHGVVCWHRKIVGESAIALTCVTAPGNGLSKEFTLRKWRQQGSTHLQCTAKEGQPPLGPQPYPVSNQCHFCNALNPLKVNCV